MRLNKFESADLKPIGEGAEKKVFVNPEDKRKVIAEMKETRKDTPRQIKGRYYLTKIAHLLLPENIPDIYEAGESPDGTQNIDVERIMHSPGHARLQEMLQFGGDEKNKESIKEQIFKEMGMGMGKLDLELERIGLSFNIDSINLNNYTKDEKGNVYYLETFKPWDINPENPEEFELLFNEEELRKAIDEIPDPKVKEKCTRYLERLLVLFDEDKHWPRENREAYLIESGPHIEALKQMFAPFLEESFLAALNTLTTEEEARSNEERDSANKILSSIMRELTFLSNETNITCEEYNDLYEKYKILSRAVGIINRGIVDHTR